MSHPISRPIHASRSFASFVAKKLFIPRIVSNCFIETIPSPLADRRGTLTNRNIA
jgi:hypothetical protein